MVQVRTALEANEHLFSRLLELLKLQHNFRSPESGSNFVVYAHDAPNQHSQAHARAVIKIIGWLDDLDTCTVTDRDPIPSRRVEGWHTMSNIFNNQMCVVPPSTERSGDPTIEAVDRIILCGSPLLESYCNNKWALDYMQMVQDCYSSSLQQGRAQLTETLNRFVDQNGHGSHFHHVLTEIALLRLRFRRMGKKHGVVPVALAVERLPYIPELTSTDLRVQVMDPDKDDLHLVFFKLLKRIYPAFGRLIKIFLEAYKKNSISKPYTDPELQQAIHLAETMVTTALRKMADSLKRDRELEEARLLREQQVQDRRADFLSKLPVINGKSQVSVPVEGTCQWLVQHDSFKKWRANIHCRVLFVTAGPGCGKSVLARYLIDSKHYATTKADLISYFFFKEDFKDQKSVVKALSSILHQVITQQRTLLLPEILEKFRDDSALFKTFDGLFHTLLTISKHPEAPRIVCIIDALDECEEDGKSLLFQAFAELHKEENQGSTLQFIITSRPYHEEMTQLKVLMGQSASLIHLDGNDNSVARFLPDAINKAIKWKVKELPKFSDNEKKIILDELTRVPNSTHLWVDLVLKYILRLKAVTSDRLAREIRRSPQTVDDAYEALLQRIEDIDQERARFLLTIVVGAERPMTVEDLALAAELKKDHWGAAQRPEVVRSDLFAEDLRVLSGLMLTVSDNKVYLLHATARAFLLGENGASTRPGRLPWKWKSTFSSTVAHRTLAEICMVRLSLDDFNLPTKAEVDEAKLGDHSFYAQYEELRTLLTDNPALKRAIMQRYNAAIKLPLLSYAIDFWVLHARGAGPLLEDVANLAFLCCEDVSQSNRTWVSHMPPGSASTIELDSEAMTEPEEPSTALAMACWWDLEPVVDFILSGKAGVLLTEDYLNEYDVDAEYSALHCAARVNNTSIIRKLIDFRGYEFGEGELDISRAGVDGYTPLHLLALHGNATGVELFLNAGADPNTHCQNRFSPLADAVGEKHPNERLIKLLLDHGADPLYNEEDEIDEAEKWLVWESDTDKTLEPLLIVAERGHTNLLRYFEKSLREGGEDINFRNPDGQTILHIAIIHGCSPQFLAMAINLGARPGVLDLRGRTPIHWAVLECREDLVLALLQNGASMECFEQARTTALHVAVKHGKKSVIGLLMNCGLDWKTMVDSKGATLLHAAVLGSQHELVADLAKSNPAFLKSVDREGFTPLHSAILHCSSNIVEFLIRSGSPVNSIDTHNNTPLQLAAAHGRADVVAALLDRGAKVDCKDKMGHTPLHLAAAAAGKRYVQNSAKATIRYKSDYPATVKVLVDRGANTHARSSNGKVPSQYAENREIANWLTHYELKRFGEQGFSSSPPPEDWVTLKSSELPEPMDTS